MKDMLPGNVIEPARVEEMIPENLSELAHTVVQKSEALAGKLHPVALQQLSGVTRITNAYYSNLIEGHITRPAEIKGALEGDYSDNEEKRALQEEAVAHVELQEEIDRIALFGELLDPTSPEYIQYLHTEFYSKLPEEFMWVRDRDGEKRFRIVPGEFRTSDVTVGELNPPEWKHVPALMDYFHLRFGRQQMGQIAKVLAIPAAHHRALYIHPYSDGNGRVMRLMSHAMCHRAGIGAGGLWSISRGLARGLGGVVGQTQYKERMQMADAQRAGAHDGRGVRSYSALVGFTEWFLEVMIDQIEFMGTLFDFENLDKRLDDYVKLRDLRPESASLLRHLLLNGEIERGDVPGIMGLAPRTGRRVLMDLLKDGIIGSETSRGAVSLRFPEDRHDMLFPRLFAGA